MRHGFGHAEKLCPIPGEECDRIARSREACAECLAVTRTYAHDHCNGKAFTIVVHCMTSITTRPLSVRRKGRLSIQSTNSLRSNRHYLRSNGHHARLRIGSC